MIKLKYIKDLRYFTFQKAIALFNILFLSGLILVNFFSFPSWFEVSILTTAMMFLIFAIVAYYKLYSINKRQYIEVDGEDVKVKDNRGKIKERGNLIKIDQLNMEFEIDTIKQYQRMWQILKGEYICSSMQIKTAKGIKQLYFWVDSHYQMNQLKSIK